MLVGLDPEKVAPFVRGLAEPQGQSAPKQGLLEEMQRAGVTPSYTQPTLFYLRDGLFCLMANHEYGVSAFDAARHHRPPRSVLGAEVHKLVDALCGARRAVEGRCSIVATAEHIGVREGRRIHGLYQVTRDDLRQAAPSTKTPSAG